MPGIALVWGDSNLRTLQMYQQLYHLATQLSLKVLDIRALLRKATFIIVVYSFLKWGQFRKLCGETSILFRLIKLL